MTELSFAAQVSKWVEETKGAAEAVFRESSQRAAEDMTRTRGAGGNMPVDTGYLRASLMASTASMPIIRESANPTAGVAYNYDAGPVNLVINTASIGETIFLGFVASYARFVNYGTAKQAPAMFVDLAAQKWPQIVKEVEAELAVRMGR